MQSVWRKNHNVNMRKFTKKIIFFPIGLHYYSIPGIYMVICFPSPSPSPSPSLPLSLSPSLSLSLSPLPLSLSWQAHSPPSFLLSLSLSLWTRCYHQMYSFRPALRSTISTVYKKSLHVLNEAPAHNLHKWTGLGFAKEENTL